MVLAELEVFQSRPIAPTRRVALGHCLLPVDPAPGLGGLLLAAVVAGFVSAVDEDFHDELERLTHQVEQGQRIPQPRLRHRLQRDHVGLNRRVHRIFGGDDGLRLELDSTDGTSPGPQVLAAVYAVAEMPEETRAPVMRLIRRGVAWRGPVDDRLLTSLDGHDSVVTAAGRFADPVAWALGVLGLAGVAPDRREVQRSFRQQLRVVHPDHGAGVDDAAQRIAELTEARRILLP